MSANKFEQELEQQLAQFQLKPSDGVWQKLEAGLQKKKRRKAFFLFFLTALLCAGGGYGVWMQTGSSTNEMVHTSAPAVTVPVSTGQTAGSESVKTKDTDTTNTATATENSTVGVKDKPAVETVGDKTFVMPEHQEEVRITHVTKQHKPADRQARKHVQGRHNKDNLTATVNTSRITAEENIPAISTEAETYPKEYQLQNAGEFADRNFIDINDSGQVAAFHLDDAAFPKPVLPGETVIQKQKQKYPFYWGVEVLAGVSGSVEKKEPYAKSSRQMDMVNSPNPNPNPQGYYNASSPLLNNTAIWESQNVHRASTSHSFGVVGYKQFTRRSALSFGASYQYLSTATKVGDSATTVNSNNTMRTYYYYGREMKNYINKFHLINIPVTHHLILNRNENMPFSWDMGMSVSQLLSTNALVMSSYMGGSLHEDKQAFTKTHFFIHTGLTIGLTNNKNRLWQLGPVVSYGLNKIGQEESDDKNFWQVGIKLRCLLR